MIYCTNYNSDFFQLYIYNCVDSSIGSKIIVTMIYLVHDHDIIYLANDSVNISFSLL